MNTFSSSALARLAGALLTLAAPVAAGGTIVVDPGGFGDATTITGGIALASPGDLILVGPGTYVEEIIVDKSVSIVGAGMGSTVVMPATDAPGTGGGSQITTTSWLFRVQASDVLIASLTIDGDNPGFGPGINARGGIITDFTVGTFDDLAVTGTEVKNVAYRGIYAAAGGTGHSFLSNVVRNVATNFLDSVGIFFFGAVGTASGNDVRDCSIGLGFQSGGGGTMVGNYVENCDIGFLANGSSSPVLIQGNTIVDSDQGIQSIAVSTTVDIVSNMTVGCLTGLTFFGLGTGSNVADDNVLDGQSLVGSAGIFATTDVTPFGFGDLTLLATNNVFQDQDVAVFLFEGVDASPTLSCTLSSSATEYNTFMGSLTFNVQLDGCDDDVDATHNYWSLVSPTLIEDTLFHQPDDGSLGLIDFSDTVNLFVTVDDDAPADFTTINPAVQAILPGGTICVRPGLYVEDVVVDRSCVIQGAGTDSDPAIGTVLRGASNNADLTVVTVTGDDVHIEKLRVDGQQPGPFDLARRGIYGISVTGLWVVDCIVHTAKSGIAYVFSSDGSFLRNEVFDFGVNLNEGGGIFLFGASGTIGGPADGNYVHDGLSTGMLFQQDSGGSCVGNRALACPLGYLSNGSDTATLFEDNEAVLCDQGYQGIANDVPVTYRRCTAIECDTGFTLFGLDAMPYLYEDVYVRGDGTTADTTGFFFTTGSIFGDDDLVATVTGSVVTGTENGVVLFETATSQPFVMDADLSGGASPNWITGNFGQDILLDECDDAIDATGNYFGSTDPGVVESRITHGMDDPLLGVVSFGGLLAPGPDIRLAGLFRQNHRLAVATTGPPGEISIPFYGVAPASIGTPFGTLLIDPSIFGIIAVSILGPGGLDTQEATIPNPTNSGQTVYVQSLVGVPGSFTLSDSDSATAP